MTKHVPKVQKSPFAPLPPHPSPPPPSPTCYDLQEKCGYKYYCKLELKLKHLLDSGYETNPLTDVTSRGNPICLTAAFSRREHKNQEKIKY